MEGNRLKIHKSNAMSRDKTIYSPEIKNRLYQFLAGLDDSLDKDKRDLLNLDPLPTIEYAYSTIREISSRGIMRSENPSSEFESSGIGSGIGTSKRTTKSTNNRRKDGWCKYRCTHCGKATHIKDECFKIVGYPQWWSNSKKKGDQNLKKQAYVLHCNGGTKGTEEKEEGAENGMKLLL